MTAEGGASPEARAAEVLRALVERCAEQCEMLERQLSNPEASPAPLVSMALEFVLKSVASAARSGLAGPLPPDLARPLRAFIVAHEGLARRTLDARCHFDRLGEGWACACGYSIPKQIEVSGLRRPPLRLLFSCKVCGAKSEPGTAGMEAFEALFGELAQGRWNPRANGFEWDGS